MTDPADTPVPPNPRLPNQALVLESGPAGADFFDYTPVDGQPGFDVAFAPSYHAVSDSTAVPEPASLALLGLGAVAVLRRRRR